MPISSMQGSTPVSTPIKKGRYQETLLDRWSFMKRGTALRNESMLWYPAFKDLSKYINPTRGFFYDNRPNVGFEIDHKTVIDSTAEDAIGTLASGMVSGLTSPSRPWFKLGLPDPDLMEYAPVNQWLDVVQNRIQDIYSKSNIYGCLYSAYEEIATFGTAAVFLQEDFKDVIRGRVYTIGEYSYGTGSDGRVNAFYRRFWMTVAQLVEEFGLDNVSPARQTAFRNNSPDIWCLINQLVEVNDTRMPEYKDYRNMQYRSIYWEDGAMMDSYLRIGGYEEFPVLAPRWSTTTTADAYGRSPGWKMLGNVKMLQKMQKNKLIALDKMTNPPVQVDASVQGEANMVPGGITKFSTQLPNAGVKPAYQVQIDIGALEAAIQTTQQMIKRQAFSDLFLMMIDAERGSPITATEVAERQSEKLTILGPVLERLENELLNPLIDRTFAIMLRNKLVPPAPKEIQGMELRVQYISILSQAQKMVGTSSVQQLLQFIGGIAQMSPSVVDNVDFDQTVREYAKMLGTPAKLLASPEVVMAVRQAKEKQQKMMMSIQAASSIADSAQKGTAAVKNMAGAPMGQNSALDTTLETLKGMVPGGQK